MRGAVHLVAFDVRTQSTRVAIGPPVVTAWSHPAQAPLVRYRSWVRTKNREHTGPGFEMNPGRAPNTAERCEHWNLTGYDIASFSVDDMP